MHMCSAAPPDFLQICDKFSKVCYWIPTVFLQASPPGFLQVPHGVATGLLHVLYWFCTRLHTFPRVFYRFCAGFLQFTTGLLQVLYTSSTRFLQVLYGFCTVLYRFC